MTYFFIGPPASGKGTQAARLSKSLGIPNFSLGELLRQQSQSDHKIAESIHNGRLVSDAIIYELLQRLHVKYPDNLIIDGMPRSVEQVGMISKLWGTATSTVIWIHVNNMITRQRVIHRREIDKSGRLDDADTVMSSRLEIYDSIRDKTLSALKNSGIKIIEIDGTPEKDIIEKEILTHINNQLESKKV